ncbi:MAG: hypothetical protein KAT77_04000 [Nanoarchaeota archaeon]|nr:hypothetical protein [Nanoarchaeota archaeon]
MKEWEDVKDLIREVGKNDEMARSLLQFIELRLNSIKRFDSEKETSLIVESYYEVIKELITGLMVIDGYKTTSHEALIIYLKKFYNEFDEYEINLTDELRKLRNKVSYEGYLIDESYLKRNQLEIKGIIKKLKDTINKKLK